MLAITPIEKNYLTAADIRIRDDEYEVLIVVRNDLASGRLKHAPIVRSVDRLNASSTFFNMTAWAGETVDCGTVHCIGGFMAAHGIYGERGRNLYSDALRELFAPSQIDRWGDLTPAQAVRAIDAFLTGAGERCWHQVLEAEG